MRTVRFAEIEVITDDLYAAPLRSVLRSIAAAAKPTADNVTLALGELKGELSEFAERHAVHEVNRALAAAVLVIALNRKGERSSELVPLSSGNGSSHKAPLNCH